MAGTAYYIVTYIPNERSEPVEEIEQVRTGDPNVDADTLIDEYDRRLGEVIEIRWNNGSGVIYSNNRYLD